MHYLMLVTLTMLPGETSPEARERVFSTLSDDNTFCGEGGRFGCPLADWFVIGGRWSGLLAETLMGDDYRNRLKERFPQFATGSFSDADVKAQSVALDELWRESGGSGLSPLTRSSYEGEGYPDDAMPLNQTLYDRLLSNFEGQTRHHAEGNHCEFVDLNDEELDESFIGRKWIAVVDYHS
jgi:hypothetical protein